jgi:hypothetical protein
MYVSVCLASKLAVATFSVWRNLTDSDHLPIQNRSDFRTQPHPYIRKSVTPSPAQKLFPL